jgi:hypothetical protein
MPPAMYTGTAVSMLAYKAMMGACGRQRPTTTDKENTHHHAKHVGRSGHQPVTRPTILGGKDLGRDGVQNPIHRLHPSAKLVGGARNEKTHVTEKHVAAVPPQKLVGRPGGGARVEKHACQRFISQEVVEW